MTKEEIKKIMPLMQAMLEGKTIQRYYVLGGEWVDTEHISLEFDDNIRNYRIKPEPKYRPFKTKEECWNEMQKHQPLGWVKRQDKKSYILFCSVNDNCDFEVDFLDFTFVDGTPFGIKEE